MATEPRSELDTRSTSRWSVRPGPSESECVVVGLVNLIVGGAAWFAVFGAGMFGSPTRALAGGAVAVLLVSAWSAWKSPGTARLAALAVTAPFAAFAAFASGDIVFHGDWEPARAWAAVALAVLVLAAGVHGLARGLRQA